MTKLGCRVAAVAAAVSMTIGFTGCGTDTDQGQLTGKATSTASSAGNRAPVKLTTATFLPAIKKAAESKNSVRTTTRTVVAGQTITTTGVASFGDHPAMSMVIDSPAFSGKARVILVDDSLYLSDPGEVPDGKYVRIAANAGSPMAKSFRHSLDGMNPRKTLAGFDAGLRIVRYVGSETVDGAKLEHYKVTVDTAAIMKAQGEKMTTGLPETITYDVWLDNSELIRKVKFTMAGMSMVMTANDYGKPVTIKAPAADDIVTG